MAPNRKHQQLTLQTVGDLDLQIAKPFAPLTSQSEQQQPSQKKSFDCVTTIHADHTRNPSHPTNSYWDWPSVDEAEKEKQDIIDTILEEEQARQLVSADHLEKSLQANAVESTSQTIYAQTTDADYWYDSNDDCATVDKPTAPQQSYWDWQTLSPQEEKQQAIDNIMDEERARQLFSIAHVVTNVIRQSAEVSTTHKHQASLQSDLYWQWSVPSDNGYWQWPNTPQDEKQMKIQQILYEEKAQSQFSADHLQNNLVRQAASIQAAPLTTSGSSYWDF